MRISLVAAATENDVIGRDGDLPWHLPDDFKHFKRLTMGHTLIMGRKTFEELGGPLPKREFIVVSSHTRPATERVRWAGSLEQALELAAGQDEVFIAGGGEIYRQAMDLADRVYLTRIHTELEGDTFFPSLDRDSWLLCDEQFHAADERHAHAFTIQRWDRRTAAR